MKLRIILADDHNIVREGLRSLIDREADFEVVGEAHNGLQAYDLTKQFVPDVVIMDLAMPDLNGIEATSKIMEEIPKVKVLALSMYADKRFVAGALRAGASGYLLKDCAFEEIAGAIRTVAGGGTYLSPGVAGIVIQDYVSRLNETDCVPLASLTPREREVLLLLSEGKSTREIAETLAINIKTVETHRRQMMEKLGVHSVAELTKYAIREGLTSVNS
ncbi:MAG: response regulator transcription factor [Pseudomonadota bacterium]